VEERRQALAFLARLRPELQAYAVRKMSPKLLAVADQISRSRRASTNYRLRLEC
jgi:hypothetical protein